jgi:plasmid stabilization system protein ParE
MARVEIGPEAAAEIETAEQFYGSRLPTLAIQFVEDLHVAISEIEAFPRIGQVVRHDLRHHLLRKFPFLLIYRIDYVGAEEVVHLIVCHHAKRDEKRWSSRE